MNKKTFSFLFSTRLMAILFIVFAVAMAVGTIIESKYNTDTARLWVYNAWWFEVIMVFFMINFIGNIKRYQLHKKEKWATLMLHLSFILILIGSFVTRYISYEGMMLIREGETENTIFSEKTYLTVLVDGDYNGEMRRKTFEEPLLLAAVTNNNFTVNESFNSIPFEVSYDSFIMNATEKIIPNENGVNYLKMVESGEGSRHDHFLKEGEVQNIHNILYAYNKFTKGAVNITSVAGALVLDSPFEGTYMRMADKLEGTVAKDSTQPLMMRSLYDLGGNKFVFPDAPIKGEKQFVSNNDYLDKGTDDALTVTINSGGKSEKVTLTGSKGKQGIPQTVKVGDLEFSLYYGSKIITLPFAIQLDKFVADKYPGTEKSYSAFKSRITLKDAEENMTRKDSIFMNNVLVYRGFRFFQSGFDPDEKGTHLSVSYDQWGTWITYIGYFLLYFAMMAILFDKNTRFNDIKVKLDKIKLKKAALSLFFLMGIFGANAQDHQHKNTNDPKKIIAFIQENKIPENEAANFGKIVVQDYSGRLKPVNTLSSELLRKVSKEDTFEGLSSDQAIISMLQYPQYWYNVPIIYIKRENDSIRKLIGVDKDAKFASLVDFFDGQGNYKIGKLLDDALHEAVPNQFQKDFIQADRKVNLLYDALSGNLLKIYPIPNDPNNKWVSFVEIEKDSVSDLGKIKNLLPFYINAVNQGNYKLSNSMLKGLHDYQQKFGKKVMLSDNEVRFELLYNKYDIFKRLFYLYMLAGVFMLIFAIIKLFTKAKWVSHTVVAFHIIIGILFLLHTAGLIVRWYISGHAPWSDAYESMIYIGWATMFFGLAFGNKSQLTVASTAFVAAMILMIAHWNWMDPSIANLQPVLNSYWLMIHVAVIVASYGPFALGMILGVVTLFLFIFTTKKNKPRLELAIAELSYINELAITVGLVMLTIGNFLGGQWANESWGRYWAWDPKETWALISIMVYAFVIHARFVPGLRSKWTFSLMTVIAFYSILMTYFGVNFYLTGLHSYASGDKVIAESNIYISFGVVILLAVVSYMRYKKFYKKQK